MLNGQKNLGKLVNSNHQIELLRDLYRQQMQALR